MTLAPPIFHWRAAAAPRASCGGAAIADFEQLMGQDGMKRLNEYAVKEAVDQGLADPRVLVADTTAQEAVIPYPNELNLMAAFLSSLATASSKAGGALKAFAGAAAEKFREGKRRLREFRLFAKDKSKAVRMRLMAQMASLIENVQSKLSTALDTAEQHRNRLVGYAKVAHAKARLLEPPTWRRLGKNTIGGK